MSGSEPGSSSQSLEREIAEGFELLEERARPRNKELHLMTEKIEKMTLEAVSRATEAEKKLEAQKNKSSRLRCCPRRASEGLLAGGN